MFKRTTSINKILKMSKRYRVIPGGTSAGKTFAIVSVLIDTAAKNHNKRIDIIAMTYEHLSSGSIADFKFIMQDTNRWIDEHWNETKHMYTFSNGSFIRFKSLDTPGKAKGPRRDILYINEANYIEYETFNQLAIRTNDYIYLDYNPTNRFWAHTEILTMEDSEELKLTYKDNEALSFEIIKDLENKRIKGETNEYWRNWCRVYLDGEIGQIEGSIFNNWNLIDNIPEEAILIGYGMDFGYTNDPTTLIAVYKYNNNIIIDEIIFSKGLSNSEIAKKMKEYNVTDEVYADSSEPKTIDELKSYGFRVKPTKKGKDSIVFGISLMQEKNILITKYSKNLIDEFTNYSWKKNRDGSADNVPEDRYNHGIDAVRYLFLMKLNNIVENRVYNITGGKSSPSKWGY